ncbi:MAG: single-stranded DNA-binding protein [Verrucomicrobiota bacterium]|nr:single-stranded DNA-binding protein [Verrucomicrobiota bacterium]
MNFAMIAGHLGGDPEVRFTSAGRKVTTMSVACRSRKGQNEDTIWYRVTIWGDQFDKMIPYFKKGSSIVVFGELHRPELFTNREGKQQISSLEITASHIGFSPFGKGNGGPSSQESTGGEAPAMDPFAQFASMAATSSPKSDMPHEDEVPF